MCTTWVKYVIQNYLNPFLQLRILFKLVSLIYQLFLELGSDNTVVLSEYIKWPQDFPNQAHYQIKKHQDQAILVCSGEE